MKIYIITVLPVTITANYINQNSLIQHQNLASTHINFFSHSEIKIPEKLEEHSFNFHAEKSKTKRSDDDVGGGPSNNVDEALEREMYRRKYEEFQYYRQYGYQCYSKDQDTYYKVNDHWFTERPFMENLTSGKLKAVYKCTCLGGETGRYTCVPSEVPCFSEHNNLAYDINERWEWRREIPFDFGRSVWDTYICTCEGGSKGRYHCKEKDPGCIDSRYNFQKYMINQVFNQTREDNLIYECSCELGENSDDDRIIRCSLKNYCMYDGEIHTVGEKWIRYNRFSNKPEHKCSCSKNPENDNSNLVECSWFETEKGQNEKKLVLAEDNDVYEKIEDQADLNTKNDDQKFVMSDTQPDYQDGVSDDDNYDIQINNKNDEVREKEQQHDDSPTFKSLLDDINDINLDDYPLVRKSWRRVYTGQDNDFASQKQQQEADQWQRNLEMEYRRFKAAEKRRERQELKLRLQREKIERDRLLLQQQRMEHKRQMEAATKALAERREGQRRQFEARMAKMWSGNKGKSQSIDEMDLEMTV